MKLKIKEAYNTVINLKYFVPYFFIFAIVSAISAIFSNANEIQNSINLGSFISILTYISLGYLFIMLNNIFKNKEQNLEESFWTSLKNSILKGFKGFVAIALNTIIFVVIVFLLLVIIVFVGAKLGIINGLEQISLKNQALWLTVLIITLLAPAMLFTLKFLPIVYSENFSIKDTFHWIKICKRFFNKEKVKETLAIIGLYVLILAFLTLCIFALTFLINLIVVLVSKYLLQNHYVALSFMINMSVVILPFVFALLHYIITGMMYVLLANVYKKECVE